MKTKQEMQAIVNELREVCKLHGVVLLPGGLDGMVLCEAERVNECPSVLHMSVDDDTMMLTNKIQEHDQRTSNFAHEVDHFTIFGIGDVEGITKPRIVISQYRPGFVEGDPLMVVDVDSLDEIDDIPFVKEFTQGDKFVKLLVGVTDGPFGTLSAAFSNHPPLVIGFIEGVSHEDLLKKWPEDLRKEDSNGPKA